jgi:predicted Rossmann fold flavoprotein
VQDTIAFFESEGVATKVEDTGKIFPVSNKALDVLNALLKRLERSGATLALEEPLRDLNRVEGGFSVITPKRTLFAPKVIITVGGQSYTGSGTTGDGYAIAAKFGHTIIAPRPALVPITVEVPWVADLRGVTLPDTGLRILDGMTPLIDKRGSLLFAHFGLSGPVALNASRAVSGHSHPTTLQLELDFLPGTPEAAFDEFMRVESLAQGKKHLAVVLAEKLPRRLCDVLLSLCGMAADRRAAGLSRADRSALVAAVKRQRLPVRGTLGFEKAEVTAGGVALDDVDSRDMQSKKAPGLYFAGEVLDLDGPIGGYNFQAAWSTGWLAGGAVTGH